MRTLLDECRMYLILYVDNMLIVGKNKATIMELKSKLHEKFSMKKINEAWHIL